MLNILFSPLCKHFVCYTGFTLKSRPRLISSPATLHVFAWNSLKNPAKSTYLTHKNEMILNVEDLWL